MMVYIHILSPILSLGINTIAQVCYSRYISNKHLLKSVFFGFFCGALSLLIIELYYLKRLSLPIWTNVPSIFVNLISYSALGYCYFHFVNLSETARRIRIISELASAKEGLSSKQILERYNAREIIENRLNRLLKSGQIIYKDDRYYIGKPTMLFISQGIIFLKLLILGKKSEFD
jgi:hypothetical protein